MTFPRESCTQLDQRPAPPHVEGGDRNQKSKVVADHDGAQPRTLADNGGHLETASKRGTHIDGRRLLSIFSEPIRSVFFAGDLHLFAGLSGTEDFFELGRQSTFL